MAIVPLRIHCVLQEQTTNRYDLGTSFVTYSKLCKDTNKEQLIRLPEGDFLELQFLQGKTFS